MDLPTTPEEPLRKVAELLDKQNQKIDLNDQPWFFDSISRQQVSDLLQDKGEIGDFVVRESSKYGHYALSWKIASISRGWVVRDFENEAKTRCNFQF